MPSLAIALPKVPVHYWEADSREDVKLRLRLTSCSFGKRVPSALWKLCARRLYLGRPNVALSRLFPTESRAASDFLCRRERGCSRKASTPSAFSCNATSSAPYNRVSEAPSKALRAADNLKSGGRRGIGQFSMMRCDLKSRSAILVRSFCSSLTTVPAIALLREAFSGPITRAGATKTSSSKFLSLCS